MTPVNTSVTITSSPQTILERKFVNSGIIENDSDIKIYRSRWNSGDTPQPAIIGQGASLSPGDKMILKRVECNFSFVCNGTANLLLQYS